jgi:hypothetical protein
MWKFQGRGDQKWMSSIGGGVWFKNAMAQWKGSYAHDVKLDRTEGSN